MRSPEQPTTSTAEQYLIEKHNELWEKLPAIDVTEICEAMVGYTAAKSEGQQSAELVEAKAEYQKLIDDEYEEVVRIAAAHGWKSSRHEKGIELRKKIEQLKTTA